MYVYKAEVIKIVDGDTIDVKIDLGFYVYTKKRLRIARINAPETKTRNKVEKQLGLKTKQFVIDEFNKVNNIVTVKVIKKGKYGRWIAEVEYDGINLSDFLVSLGLAKYVNY